MNVAGETIGLRYNSYEIYLSGCPEPHCPGCHNPELWDYNIGKDYKTAINHENIDEAYKSGLIKYIWILGGEPLSQNQKELEDLLITLKIKHPKIPIILWTRETNFSCKLAFLLDYIKIGKYDNTRKSYIEPILNIELASDNQSIVKIYSKPF